MTFAFVGICGYLIYQRFILGTFPKGRKYVFCWFELFVLVTITMDSVERLRLCRRLY